MEPECLRHTIISTRTGNRLSRHGQIQKLETDLEIIINPYEEIEYEEI